MKIYIYIYIYIYNFSFRISGGFLNYFCHKWESNISPYQRQNMKTLTSTCALPSQGCPRGDKNTINRNWQQLKLPSTHKTHCLILFLVSATWSLQPAILHPRGHWYFVEPNAVLQGKLGLPDPALSNSGKMADLVLWEQGSSLCSVTCQQLRQSWRGWRIQDGLFTGIFGMKVG
jgi:hypothetical protein